MTMRRPGPRRRVALFSLLPLFSVLRCVQGQASALLGDGNELQAGPRSLSLNVGRAVGQDDDTSDSTALRVPKDPGMHIENPVVAADGAAAHDGDETRSPGLRPLGEVVDEGPDNGDTKSPGLRPLEAAATDAALKLEPFTEEKDVVPHAGSDVQGAKEDGVADAQLLPLRPPVPLAPGTMAQPAAANEVAEEKKKEWDVVSFEDDSAATLRAAEAAGAEDDGPASAGSSGGGATSSSSNGKLRRPVLPPGGAPLAEVAEVGASAGGAVGEGNAHAGSSFAAAAEPPSAGAAGLREVQEGLDRLRDIEGAVEKHLEDLLRAVYGARLDAVNSPAAAGGGGTGTTSNANANANSAAEERLAAVQRQFADIRESLRDLVNGINSTSVGVSLAGKELRERASELTKLKDHEQKEEILKGFNDGTLKVDYTTGNILPQTPAANGTVAVNVEQVMVQQREELEQRKNEADPAVLHMDNVILRDVVILSMAAAIGGASAATLRVPHTLGYIMGGMVVGPTGFNLVSKVVEAETFAQFGSIFLLFGHGLAYSRHATASRPAAARAGATGGGGAAGFAAVAGAAVGPLLGSDGAGRLAAFTVLFVCYSALMLCLTMTGLCSNMFEQVFVAAAATLSSTAVVTEFVWHSGLGDSAFARMVIDLVGVQDLVMCPLLAVPTAIMHLAFDFGGLQTIWRLFLYSVIMVGSAVAARRMLPAAMRVLARGTTAQLYNRDCDAVSAGQAQQQPLQLLQQHQQQAQLMQQQRTHNSLFLLGVVAYCLAFSLMCESLKLSHEAGALFAGLLMFDSPHAARAAASVEPLTSFFGGIYLASLGMIVDPGYVATNLWSISTCVLLIGGIKFLVVVGVMRSFGFSLPAAVMAGGCMAQVSEISLFFVARAQQMDMISRHLYLMMVASTVVLLSVSPFLVAAVRRLNMKRFEPGLARNGSNADFQLINGAAEAELLPVLHAPPHGGGGGHKRRHRAMAV